VNVRHALRSIAIAGALALAAVLPARAGGPFGLVNHQPIVFPNGGAITLNLDRGALGARTNAQAVTLVKNAIALWNGVNTSTMRFTIGNALATDYTASNYSAVYSNNGDGLNPVLFDTDGAILDALFGQGTKNYMLGYAGSTYSASGIYLEGHAVVNGYLSMSDATTTMVIAHELGHLFGIDHTQLDDSQGLPRDDYPVMYPVVYRTLNSLHEDDAASVTALYPAGNVASVYGKLTGTFTDANGAPILGTNIWAEEVTTGKLYSVVSDFLAQGNGYFRLYLPAGTYQLNAEPLEPSFFGASSVGPYARSSSDPSFQKPNPINPVALGGATPQRFTITAGCAATATFRSNGGGSVTGDCGSTMAGGSGTPVVAPPSSNAMLSNLTLSAGTLAPGFASATQSYRVTVDASVATFNVKPSPADAAATMRVNGMTVSRGNYSPPIALANGDTRISIDITAPDGKTNRTYVVTVTRTSPEASFFAQRDARTVGEQRGTGVVERRFAPAGAGRTTSRIE